MTRKTLVLTAIGLIGTIAAVVAYLVISSRQLSPAGIASVSFRGLDVKVDYHRPSVRGRIIFGDSSKGALQPNGKYWRLGANEATEISFNKNVTFAGKPVNAGRYRMYAVPHESTWEVSLNSELDKWGYDEPNHALDVLKVEVPIDWASSVTELFTITFEDDSTAVNMQFAWDRARVRIPIGLQ